MERFAILSAVLVLHLAVLVALWAKGMPPTPAAQPLVYVDLLAALPQPSASAAVPPPGAPRTDAPPRSIGKAVVTTKTGCETAHAAALPSVADSAVSTVEPPATAAVDSETTAAPTAALAAPAAPAATALPPAVLLGGELAVSCPLRPPPVYPPLSRRLGEEGAVVLRVELDEQGTVSRAAIVTGSGSPRLDEAALAAVQSWRCQPAWQDGRPVPAIALQPFQFVLRGS